MNQVLFCAVNEKYNERLETGSAVRAQAIIDQYKADLPYADMIFIHEVSAQTHNQKVNCAQDIGYNTYSIFTKIIDGSFEYWRAMYRELPDCQLNTDYVSALHKYLCTAGYHVSYSTQQYHYDLKKVEDGEIIWQIDNISLDDLYKESCKAIWTDMRQEDVEKNHGQGWEDDYWQRLKQWSTFCKGFEEVERSAFSRRTGILNPIDSTQNWGQPELWENYSDTLLKAGA